ncbi:excalibur calcium-binding domain-containing protein [Oceanibacterium hippocampi]|nr:excalibur calcium-binding domain-containing protein [Oceanibacterium hippocampi]
MRRRPGRPGGRAKFLYLPGRRRRLGDEAVGERRAAALKRRFARTSAPCFRASNGRRELREWGLALLIVSLAAAAAHGLFVASPWPPVLTLRHVAAAPNCGAARLAGLAPARRGAPGYYARHDADHDGIACEPWAGARSDRYRPRRLHHRIPMPSH